MKKYLFLNAEDRRPAEEGEGLRALYPQSGKFILQNEV